MKEIDITLCFLFQGDIDDKCLRSRCNNMSECGKPHLEILDWEDMGQRWEGLDNRCIIREHWKVLLEHL